MNQNKALRCRVREGWGSVYEWGRTATLLCWGESRAWRWAFDSLASLHSYPHPSPADVGNDRKNKIKDTIYRNELWLKSVRPQPQMETRTRSHGCKRIFYTRLYNLGGGRLSSNRKVDWFISILTPKCPDTEPQISSDASMWLAA